MHHFVVNINIAKNFKNYCQNISFSLIFLFFSHQQMAPQEIILKKSQTHKSGDSPTFFSLLGIPHCSLSICNPFCLYTPKTDYTL